MVVVAKLQFVVKIVYRLLFSCIYAEVVWAQMIAAKYTI